MQQQHRTTYNNLYSISLHKAGSIKNHKFIRMLIGHRMKDGGY